MCRDPLTDRVIVRIDLPLCDTAISDNGSPCSGCFPQVLRAQGAIWSVGPPGGTHENHELPVRTRLPNVNLIVRDHLQVRLPPLSHLRRPADNRTKRIDETVVIGHESRHGRHVMGVDCGHESKNHIDRSHA